ncbi:MAG: flagellar basal body protein FliL [Methylophaga sp.]|nr:flagellar basal body protein FliL [Methylophaga sp.]
MAEKIDDVEVVDEAGGKSKKMIIIIAVAVLALIGGGAAMFLGGDEASPDETSEAEAAPAVKQTPIYFAVEKPLVVNFSDQSEGAVSYLQVKLKVMARDQTTIDAFTLHTPAIQHELLMLLLGQKYDDLSTTTGTKALQQQTLKTINEVLKAEKHQGELEAVYFTSLIMQ